ncbi:MAG TPA: phosphomethylpyrimidine synthase ThiC [bacterium]|nr:phosphomethylpyrimidine synthase ThiC [bacterium]
MSLILETRKGNISAELAAVARDENRPVETVAAGVACGTVVVPKNRLRRLARPCGIGTGLKTKVNANIGTSTDVVDVDAEMKKMAAAVDAGADALMDLSTGGNLMDVRRMFVSKCPVPIGTVPVYDVMALRFCCNSPISALTSDDFLRAVEDHAKSGVDFVTVHCGLTRRALAVMLAQGRLMDIVSRGGAFLAQWMTETEKENPLFEHYDRLLEIALRYDVTLSLGDGMRPGSVIDATDRAQIEELIVLGGLAQRALAAGVQVMIEGPGHVPLDQVAENIRLEKSLCNGAPFYVLGPLVTDCAPGYDHITSAIGGAIAASAGADFLCYVTPSEHLRLPSIDDVREGVIAARIAAHAGDIVKKVPGAIDRDRAMSEARKKRDWERQISLAIDPEKARAYRSTSTPKQNDVCTMCGDLCSMKMTEGLRKEQKREET